jgi:broad specificity phosphatase PhoE
MSNVILIRHGETEWSRSGRHTGRTDIPLTAGGEEQARALAPVIAKRTIARVFVSPLQRARRTAELAGLTSSVIDPELQEWDYGGYEGITKTDILAARPDWDLWRDGVVPGNAEHPGETVGDVVARVDAAIGRVRPLLDDAGDVVLVAHGHVLRMFAVRWLELAPAAGARFRLDPATMSILGLVDGVGALFSWNMTP